MRELDPPATPPEVLRRLAPPLVQTVLDFEQQGFAPFQASFNARDVLRGRAVTLSDGQQGMGRGVNDKGEFLLAQGDALVRIHSAEVSVRPL